MVSDILDRWRSPLLADLGVIYGQILRINTGCSNHGALLPQIRKSPTFSKSRRFCLILKKFPCDR
ncbi:MAG TPA: hypothetical protein V6C58_01305 [Allocoleopsis sp.]